MTMDVHPIDFQTMRVIEAHVSPSYLIHDLNYSDTFQSADVVAVLEVTEDIMTFQLPHRHTLYRATIVQWLKGESTRSLYLYQLEGYDPDHDVFIHLDLNVLLRPSERWLLFLNKRTMPRIA